MAYSFDDSRRPSGTPRSTSRCSATAASTTRLDGRDTAQNPLGARGPQMPALDDDVWELYGPNDWTQAHDLAGEQPEKLRELQRLFLIEAAKYNVLPLDDRAGERLNPDMAGRPPSFVASAAPLRWHGPPVRELDRQHQEQVARRHGRDRVPTAAQGRHHRPGRSIGGWSLYPGRQTGVLLQPPRHPALLRHGETEVPAGTHQVRMEFDYAGPGLGKGGNVTSTSTASRPGRARLTRPPR